MSNSILAKIKASNLNKAINTTTRTEMTNSQVEQCKAALRRDNRGYNVQPNRFDIDTPYRVAINYQNDWTNFGNFKSADVAAAIGTIVAVAYFGEKAVTGEYDEAIVDASEEFKAWIADPRNANVLAMASGDKPSVNDGGEVAKKGETEAYESDANPF